MTKSKESKRRGPKAETVKLTVPWEKAVSDALKKKRPARGWSGQPKPKPDKKKPA